MFAPARTDAPDRFAEWLERQDAEGRIYLCVVTVHEIEKGIARLEAKGAFAKARDLSDWLQGLFTAYGDLILGLDAAGAKASGRLEAAAKNAGHDPGMADAIVAGIAHAHDLVVVTRNVGQFRPFRVPAVTPEIACGEA